MNTPNPFRSKPGIFLTRQKEYPNNMATVEAFRGGDPNKDEGLWELVFTGTSEECTRFTKNMHLAVSPDMLSHSDALKPKRIIE